MKVGRAVVAGLLAWVLVGLTAPACPFCTMSGETLSSLADQSNLIVFGSLKAAKAANDPNDPAAGSSLLAVEAVVKPHADFKGDKLEINRYFEVEAEGKYKFLVFCDLYKGKIEPFRGMAVPANSDIAKYVKGALALQKEATPKRLRFFFDYLDNKDQEVSIDAYKEFGNTDYKDVKELAPSLPAEKLAGWLTDKDTPAFRLGLYAMLLGHAGQKDRDKYADLLHHLLEDPEKRVLSGVDGILSGYVLLKPKDGWDYVVGLMTDPKRPFGQRYAGLRAARFFWEYHQDVIGKAKLVDAVTRLLGQKDIADLAVEDLRKWEAWEETAKVLALQKSESYELPIVRRSVIRFALAASEKVPAAKAFVAAERARDAALVADAEELLRLEQPVKDK